MKMLEFMVKRRWNKSNAVITGCNDREIFMRSELHGLFDRQVAKVLSPKVFPNLGFGISVLAFLLNSLRQKIPEKIVCGENNLSILLVLGKFLPLDEQLNGMQIREMDKGSWLRPYLHCKFIPSEGSVDVTPELPYLLFDVEPGRKTKGLSEEKCRKTFSIVERSGLNIYEVVAFITHFPSDSSNYSGALETKVVSNPGSLTSRTSSVFVHMEHTIMPPIWGNERKDYFPIKVLAGENENEETIAKEQQWPSYKMKVSLD